MNYCSNCGALVKFQEVEGDDRMRHYCKSCDTIHYQNPNIVTGCLPTWEDKVLLCKRAIPPRIGYWNVPGGYLENGETVEEGAIREVWEEAEAKVVDLKLLTLFSISRINQIYMHFLAPLEKLDYKAGQESLEVALFTEKEIPWEEIAFTSSIFTLQAYFLNRKKKIHQLYSSNYLAFEEIRKNGGLK